MTVMTPRERYRAVIHFKKPDVLPWVESFIADETLLSWLRDDLPAHEIAVIEMDYSERVPFVTFPRLVGFDLHSYFGCTPRWQCVVPVDVGPIPRFKKRILGGDDRYVELRTATGAVIRHLRKAEYKWYSMPQYLDFPVKDRESWQEYKERLNPNDPRRYPKDWEKDSYITVFESYQRGVTQLALAGFYGFGAQLMGIPNFIVMFYKDPELMHEMVDHWAFFTIEAIRDAVEALKDRIDQVFWWEDLAERHGPCISPKIYREFFLPRYRRVTGFLRRNKIDRIMMECDGNTKPLLDLTIEAGITGHWPLEVNSGMDAVALKRQYGNKLFLAGNLDKREIARGGEAMRKEIDSKVPMLKEMGGYIPGLDHIVSAGFTLERFREYSCYLKKYLMY